LCDPQVVKQYGAGVRTASVLGEVVEGVPLRVTLAPVLVSAADLDEILVDKLHALVGRRYLKHRDVFDLWWLAAQGLNDWSGLLHKHYANHARMYAASPRLDQLSPLLRNKASEIARLSETQAFSDDLKRWLGADSTTASRISADAIAASVSRQVAGCADRLDQPRMSRRAKGAEP
jgi:hypothetical protein